LDGASYGEERGGVGGKDYKRTCVHRAVKMQGKRGTRIRNGEKDNRDEEGECANV